ncbi:unnamed protein product [Moneuplotes crassus]|uniref:RING-type domain-containing protein n=1 Tax=Euplotes crassus TaxID=5936 RepID=A0AAD1XDE9_EUPCR|nr:unnamed protein product [Moneuplotes crassus]
MDPESDCNICLERITEVYTLNCGHIFHKDCITIIKDSNQPKCPTCRAPISKDFPLKVFVKMELENEDVRLEKYKKLCRKKDEELQKEKEENEQLGDQNEKIVKELGKITSEHNEIVEKMEDFERDNSFLCAKIKVLNESLLQAELEKNSMAKKCDCLKKRDAKYKQIISEKNKIISNLESLRRKEERVKNLERLMQENKPKQKRKESHVPTTSEERELMSKFEKKRAPLITTSNLQFKGLNKTKTKSNGTISFKNCFTKQQFNIKKPAPPQKTKAALKTGKFTDSVDSDIDFDVLEELLSD